VVVAVVLSFAASSAKVAVVEAPQYLLGTLETDPNRASQEYAAGFRIAEQTVGWNNYEPQDGVFDAGYITSIKQRIQTFQRAGLKVVISPAIQYPPAWVFSLPGSRYVNQYGAVAPATWVGGFEEPNVVFSQAVRDRVAGFETKVMQELGPGNIWAVRYVNGSLGEVLYPPANDLLGHNNSYWAYDANAQNNASADRPPGLHPNPFPGWQPGQTTYNGQPFSVAQVQQWYEWYVDARMDFVNWHTKLFRDLGFTGYLQLQTPGFGVRPSEYAASTANFLDGTGDPNQTMGRAAIWQKVYAKLTDRSGVIAYVSSMADGSGNPQDQGCQATDTQVDLEHDPQVNNWSGVRYVSHLADLYGMIKSGENPASGDPNRNVVYGLSMLNNATAQMAACSFQGMFWAQDQNLYDGVSGVKPAAFTALAG
jgi:Beta-galactosidase